MQPLIIVSNLIVAVIAVSPIIIRGSPSFSNDIGKPLHQWPAPNYYWTQDVLNQQYNPPQPVNYQRTLQQQQQQQQQHYHQPGGPFETYRDGHFVVTLTYSEPQTRFFLPAHIHRFNQVRFAHICLADWRLNRHFLLAPGDRPTNYKLAQGGADWSRGGQIDGVSLYLHHTFFAPNGMKYYTIQLQVNTLGWLPPNVPTTIAQVNIPVALAWRSPYRVEAALRYSLGSVEKLGYPAAVNVATYPANKRPY